VFSWNRVIGIFGGSFDPPHAGHRAAVAGLFELPGLKGVWVMPSGNPPWKAASTPAQSRLEMAELAFAGMSDVQVLPWEIELAGRVSGEATTTWKLLDFIQPRLQGAEIAWVIGADQLLGLDRWNRFPAVLGRCHWVVLLRKGAEHTEEAVHRKMADFEAAGHVRRDIRSENAWTVSEALTGGKLVRVELVATEAPEVSSTRIREEAGRTGDVKDAAAKGWLSPAVAHYLKEKKLYGTRNHDL
jgi:nicotinate (nicotinamide) nucleotide adenylyltransferase